MSINELKNLSPRELNKFMSNITAKEIKEMLNNENLGGGLSKYNKDTLVDILLDLIYETNDSGLMDTLKPKKVRKNKKKAKIEESKEDKNFKNIVDEIVKNLLDSSTINCDEYYEEFAKWKEKSRRRREYEDSKPKEFKTPFSFMYFEIHRSLLNSIDKDVLDENIFKGTMESFNKNHKIIDEGVEIIAKHIHRQLVKYYHPDKATGNTEKFRDLQEDWEEFKKEIEYNNNK